MADVSENCVKNVLAESSILTKEGNNACSEESKLNTVVENCDNKNLSVNDPSSCEKHDMSNKDPEQVSPQNGNKKEIDEKSKKNVNSNEDQIIKDNKKIKTSKKLVGGKHSEKHIISSRRLNKSPTRRSISPRHDIQPRRSLTRYVSGFSPERHYQSPKWDAYPKQRSLSPPPYYVFKYYDRQGQKHTAKLKDYESEYRHPRGYSRSPIRYDDYNILSRRYDLSPERYISSRRRSLSHRVDYTLSYNESLTRRSRSPTPLSSRRYVSSQRYDLSPERYISSRRRSLSHRVDYTLSYNESLTRRSRSPTPSYDREKVEDNIFDRQRGFSPKSSRDKNQVKVVSVVETGLVPPGTEAEFGLSTLPHRRRSITKDIGKDTPLRSEKRVLERCSFSPPYSKTIRTEKIDRHHNSYKEIRKPSKRSSPLIEDSSSKRKCKIDEVFVMKKEKKEDIVAKKEKSFSKDRSKEFTVKKDKSLAKKRKSFLEEMEEKLQLTQSNTNISRNELATSSGFQNNSSKQLRFPGTSPISQVNLNMVMQPGTHQLYNSQPQMTPHNLPQSIGQHGFLQQDALHMPQQMSLAMQHVPQPVPTPFFSRPINNPLMNTQLSVSAQNWNQDEKEKFEKILADKKTTLSDCVHLAPKLTDKPMNFQNKIKVITRCQQAIKLLETNTKTTGKFVMKISQNKPEKHAEIKGLSPFKRPPVTRFQFTSNQGAEENHSISVWLNKYLIKLGQKPVFDAPSKEPTTSLTGNMTAELLQHESLPEKQTQLIENQSKNIQKSTATLSTQTEDISCSECEKRNNIFKNNIYTQTNEVPLSFDVSCQVNLEQPVAGILKKKAITLLLTEQLKANPNTQEVGISSSPSTYNPNIRNMSNLEYSGPKRLRLGEHGFVGLEDESEDRAKKIFSDYNNEDMNPYGDGYINRYPQESNLHNKTTSSLSNTRFLNKERPPFSMSIPSKTVPFANFDHKLDLGLSKSYMSSTRDLSKKPPYDGSPPTGNLWSRR